MSPAIETASLSKHYGSRVAVDQLTLCIEAGQVFGFLGPNGAGKSTTIRMLLALQRPTRGAATVLGLDTTAHSVDIHRRVGYLPGDLALYPRLTGRHHIDWFRHARGLADDPLVGELIERFQVVVDRQVHKLSKGNRQKIGIVLAFMHRPELLILDEPTSGLDPLMQREFGNLLRETVGEGRTVFLSSMNSMKCSASRTRSRSSRTDDWSRRIPSRDCARPLPASWKCASGAPSIQRPCAPAPASK